jgi:hypothetical protein
MKTFAALFTCLVATVALAVPPKTDMAIAAVDVELMEPTGELYPEFWNGPEEGSALLVQITTTSAITKGEPSFVPGRKLELVVTQETKELQRKSLALEGGSTTGKRRFALTINAKWERCVPIKVEVTITGQGKKATKSKVFSVQCGG